MKRRLLNATLLLALGLPLAIASNTMAGIVDLTSVTPGGPGAGACVGTLDGLPFTASLLAGGSQYFTIRPVGGDVDYRFSTIADSSPQFSYGTIYTPSQPLSDRLGYEMRTITPTETATLQVDFAQLVTNPVFHVANLDGMIYDFSPSGLTAVDLLLLSGNGGPDLDGLVVDTTNPIIADGIAGTAYGVSPFNPPPIYGSGGRSAYGSVQLTGSFTTLTIDLRPNPTARGGDSGSFIISTSPSATPIPEPTTIVLMGFGILGLLGLVIRQRRKTK